MSPRKKESVISRSPLIDCLRGTSAIAAYATLFNDVTVSMVVHLLVLGIKNKILTYFLDFKIKIGTRYSDLTIRHV